MRELKFGGKTYRESHPLVAMYGKLIQVQALLFAFPKKWGDFSPHEYATQFLYSMDAALTDPNPKSKDIVLQELAEAIEKQTVFISESNFTKHPIASIEQNKDMMLLLAATYELLQACMAAKDHIELENKSLSQNLLFILDKMVGYIHVFMEWVRAFVFVYSIDDSGKLLAQAKVTLWDLETIKRLNV